MTTTMRNYKEEVLGKGVAIEFRVGNGKHSRPYKGKVRRVQISQEYDDAPLEVLHQVVFKDGEDHWLDLTEVEGQGRLQWLEDTKLRKEPYKEEEVARRNSTDTTVASEDESLKETSTKTTTTSTTTTSSTTTSGKKPIRVSLNKAKMARRQILSLLVAQNDNAAPVPVVTPAAADKKKKKKDKKRKSSSSSSSSTKKKAKKQREYDPNVPVWIEEMLDWMIRIGADGRGCTEKSALRIRKEVLKLAAGEGVTHKQWTDQGLKPFLQGVKIDLNFDMDDLWDRSQEWQDLHGKDPSHGWLLKIPIGKLKAYKEYRIQNGIQLD